MALRRGGALGITIGAVVVLGLVAGVAVMMNLGASRTAMVSVAGASASGSRAVMGKRGGSAAAARQMGLFQEKDFENGYIQFPEQGLRSVKQVGRPRPSPILFPPPCMSRDCAGCA
jgi:hypothetical protein